MSNIIPLSPPSIIRGAIDPSQANDVATKNYVDNRPSGSNTIIATTNPTTSTIGAVGQFYVNTTSSALFVCDAIPNPPTTTNYVWLSLTGSGSGNRFGSCSVIGIGYNGTSPALTPYAYPVVNDSDWAAYAIPMNAITDQYFLNSGSGQINGVQYITGNPSSNTNYGWGLRFPTNMQASNTGLFFEIEVNSITFNITFANPVTNPTQFSNWSFEFIISSANTGASQLNPTNNAIAFLDGTGVQDRFLWLTKPTITYTNPSGNNYIVTLTGGRLGVGDNFGGDYVGSNTDYVLYMAVTYGNTGNQVTGASAVTNLNCNMVMSLYLQGTSGSGGGGGGSLDTTSVVNANGFSGTTATTGTNSAITLSTSNVDGGLLASKSGGLVPVALAPRLTFDTTSNTLAVDVTPQAIGNHIQLYSWQNGFVYNLSDAPTDTLNFTGTYDGNTTFTFTNITASQLSYLQGFGSLTNRTFVFFGRQSNGSGSIIGQLALTGSTYSLNNVNQSGLNSTDINAFPTTANTSVVITFCNQWAQTSIKSSTQTNYTSSNFLVIDNSSLSVVFSSDDAGLTVATISARLPTAGTNISITNGVISTTSNPTFTGGSISGLTALSTAPSFTPTNATDVTNKEYVDTLVTSNLHYGTSVIAIAETQININTPPATIDGVTLATGDRIALGGQGSTTVRFSPSPSNGVYIFTNTTTALTRSTDANGANIVGLAFAIDKGTTYSGFGFTFSATLPFTIGTSNLTCAKLSGVDYSAGTNIDIENNIISVPSSPTFSGDVNIGGGLTVGTDTPTSTAQVLPNGKVLITNTENAVKGQATTGSINTTGGIHSALDIVSEGTVYADGIDITGDGTISGAVTIGAQALTGTTVATFGGTTGATFTAEGKLVMPNNSNDALSIYGGAIISGQAKIKTLILGVPSTTSAVTLSVPATTTPYSLTLPSTQSSTNQALINNGSGGCFWGNIGLNFIGLTNSNATLRITSYTVSSPLTATARVVLGTLPNPATTPVYLYRTDNTTRICRVITATALSGSGITITFDTALPNDIWQTIYDCPVWYNSQSLQNQNVSNITPDTTLSIGTPVTTAGITSTPIGVNPNLTLQSLNVSTIPTAPNNTSVALQAQINYLTTKVTTVDLILDCKGVAVTSFPASIDGVTSYTTLTVAVVNSANNIDGLYIPTTVSQTISNSLRKTGYTTSNSLNNLQFYATKGSVYVGRVYQYSTVFDTTLVASPSIVTLSPLFGNRIYGGTILAYRNSQLSVGNGIDTVIPWDTSINNNTPLSVSSGVVTNTSSSTITAIITAQVQFASNATGQRLVYISKNGVATSLNRLAQQQLPAVSGDTTCVSVTTTVSLAPTDTIRVYLYHTAGATLICGGPGGGIADGYGILLNITIV